MDDKGLVPWRSASITEGMGACCEEGLAAYVTSPCGGALCSTSGKREKVVSRHIHVRAEMSTGPGEGGVGLRNLWGCVAGGVRGGGA